VFDKDMTGFIGVGQLKYILTNLGEKMSEEEVDELLKAVDTSSGQVNYTGMCPIRASVDLHTDDRVAQSSSAPFYPTKCPR